MRTGRITYMHVHTNWRLYLSKNSFPSPLRIFLSSYYFRDLGPAGSTLLYILNVLSYCLILFCFIFRSINSFVCSIYRSFLPYYFIYPYVTFFIFLLYYFTRSYLILFFCLIFIISLVHTLYCSILKYCFIRLPSIFSFYCIVSFVCTLFYFHTYDAPFIASRDAKSMENADKNSVRTPKPLHIVPQWLVLT